MRATAKEKEGPHGYCDDKLPRHGATRFHRHTGGPAYLPLYFVFISHAYRSLCQTTHEWFAKDAWVVISLPGFANRRVSAKPPSQSFQDFA